MLKLFKNSFKTTNDCIILATPLVIFLSILGWYYSYAEKSVNNIPNLILASLTMLIMLSGFISAWFYMVKKTLKFSDKIFVFDKDRIKAFKELILSLPIGIGRLFLPFCGVILITGILYGLTIWFITYIVVKYLGTVNLVALDLPNILLSSKYLLKEMSELSRHDALVINCWYLLVMTFNTIYMFLTIFWIPELVYSEKNPFKALFNSIRKVFITFPKTLLLFIYINFLSVLISIFNTLLMFRPILYFLVLLIYYYFIVYMVVLIFSYYEQTFLSNKEN